MIWDNYGTTMGQLWDNYGITKTGCKRNVGELAIEQTSKSSDQAGAFMEQNLTSAFL